jgi:putative exporter of polyketide antibiotics
MQSDSQHAKPWAATVVAECTVRVVYFVATAVALPAGTALLGGLLIGHPSSTTLKSVAPLLQHTVLSPFPTSPYWLLVFVLSFLAAALGPRAYASHRDRGRGQLEAIRMASRMGPPDGGGEARR